MLKTDHILTIENRITHGLKAYLQTIELIPYAIVHVYVIGT